MWMCYLCCSGKSQQLYEAMLRAIVTAADNRGCSVDPTTVVCDFEMAVINAVGAVLGPHVAVQGCFYHLCQSTWRRVQEIGLTVTYRQEDEVKLFCGMLDGLAFLPVTQVEAGMQFLRTVIPDHDGLSDLVDYFDSTYVTARLVESTVVHSHLPLMLVRLLSAYRRYAYVVYHRPFRHARGTSTTLH